MVQRSKVFKEKSAQTKQQHGDYKLFWIFLKYFSITMKKYAHKTQFESMWNHLNVQVAIK